MSHTPCTGPHAMRITFARRRSDFERDARVTPFTGSCCCCCCCLHWIGAAVAGGIGMRAGWIAGEKLLAAPLPAEGKSALGKGLILGVAVSVGLLVGSIALVISVRYGTAASLGEFYLIALGLVPLLAFVPVGATMLAAAYRARAKKLAAFRAEIAKLPAKDGTDASMSLYRAKLTPAPKTGASITQFSVFCRHCWFDLGESMHLTTCPECNQAIGEPLISGPDYGVNVAWRASLTAIGAATGGTVAGYLLMLIISLFIK